MHEAIQQKLEGFYRKNRIPNLLFHGANGTGKRTLVYNFINRIYDQQKARIKTNVMFVNCAHGKGIKFIRDELKFFAKTNTKGGCEVRFKTIVLFHADSLTIDAQSALRRCIELFSFNTRFFIVVENKHRLLNPIVSRFCEIYVPETLGRNLHVEQLERVYGGLSEAPKVALTFWRKHAARTDLLALVHEAYEAGYTAIDLVDWIRTDCDRTDVVMHYHRIRAEYRCEKLLMFCLLTTFTS